MNISTVASLSTNMHLAQTQQSAEVTVMKKALDMQQTEGNEITQMMQAADPVNHQLDILA
ncbi:MAG TPA: hypothetical protein DHW78_10940 [Ruminococcaceae bacterium]|jgi:hypothetical protein|nr:YjfB family protein [Oscillospiraceae bacterium]HCA72155.1 hypothetical protein [Oscillospiraceae bacterium]HCC01941.1 hypothetical protein [Oscillospiraceae bacterium]HCM24821.1 hypothetical protein [Oscillospiraceae bacterium]